MYFSEIVFLCFLGKYLVVPLLDHKVAFFFLTFYLFIGERERVHMHKLGAGAEAEGEADSPPSREVDVGLNHRTSRSQLEPKSDA